MRVQPQNLYYLDEIADALGIDPNDLYDLADDYEFTQLDIEGKRSMFGSDVNRLFKLGFHRLANLQHNAQKLRDEVARERDAIISQANGAANR